MVSRSRFEPEMDNETYWETHVAPPRHTTQKLQNSYIFNTFKYKKEHRTSWKVISKAVRIVDAWGLVSFGKRFNFPNVYKSEATFSFPPFRIPNDNSR
jgi:hypothetical protein